MSSNRLILQPEDIYYMITINCNQRCSKCSHWKYPPYTKTRLAPQKIVDFLCAIPSCKEFVIVGGEPLLFKNEIQEILFGLKNTDIRTVIITNGYALDRSFIDETKDYHVHFVFSIDTVDRDFWKFVRGTDSYDRCMSNFEYAFKHLTGWQISIQSVLAEETRDHIPGVKRYAEEHHVSHTVQDYISEGFEGYWTPLKDKVSNIPSGEQQCYAAGRNVSIMQDGSVMTCFQQNWMEGCEMPLGNLHTDNVEDIINTKYAQGVVMKMKLCNKPCKVLKCNLKK
ncbi:MAG: radical SAM protein [Bacteroidales bacterium]|nr:radical SAM protein [Bacteroidales bacterium]